MITPPVSAYVLINRSVAVKTLTGMLLEFLSLTLYVRVQPRGRQFTTEPFLSGFCEFICFSRAMCAPLVPHSTCYRLLPMDLAGTKISVPVSGIATLGRWTRISFNPRPGTSPGRPQLRLALLLAHRLATRCLSLFAHLRSLCNEGRFGQCYNWIFITSDVTDFASLARQQFEGHQCFLNFPCYLLTNSD
jgi:hypothetical protein